MVLVIVITQYEYIFVITRVQGKAEETSVNNKDII